MTAGTSTSTQSGSWVFLDQIAFPKLSTIRQNVVFMGEQYCSGIAALILNIQVIVDLNKIAVGGGISAQPAVVKEINRQYDLLLKNVTPLDDILTRPQIVNAELKNDANLYGAVYAAKRS